MPYITEELGDREKVKTRRREGKETVSRFGNNLNKYTFVKDGGMSIEFKKFTVTVVKGTKWRGRK